MKESSLSRLFSAFLFSMMLIIAFWLGFSFHVFQGWGQPSASPPSPTALPVSQTGLDPVNLQLIERVKDATTYVDITVTLMGILAALLATALGLSIWKTHEYALTVLERSFSNWRSEELDPALQDSQKELEDMRTQGTLLILQESRILLDDLLQRSQEIYKCQLESSGKTTEDVAKLLEEREKRLRDSNQVTEYLVASLSRDPSVVEDACQKLFALAGNEVVVPRIDAISDHLYYILPTWKRSGSTQREIQSLVDTLQRRKRGSR